MSRVHFSNRSSATIAISLVCSSLLVPSASLSLSLSPSLSLSLADYANDVGTTVTFATVLQKRVDKTRVDSAINRDKRRANLQRLKTIVTRRDWNWLIYEIFFASDGWHVCHSVSQFDRQHVASERANGVYGVANNQLQTTRGKWSLTEAITPA